MIFKEEYTTKSRKEKDPTKEANKVEISEDTYAIATMIEEKLESIRIVSLIR